MTNSKTKGLLLAILGPLLWGISGSCAQFLFQSAQVDSTWLVSVRLLFSGILLVGYGLITDKNNLAILKDKRDLFSLFMFSIFGMVASQYFYFLAIDFGNAATAAILQFLGPTVIIIYLLIFERVIPRRVDVISVILALAGTFLLVTHGSLTGLAIPFLGFIMGILSAVGSASYTLMPRRLLQKYGAIPVVGWSMLIGGIIFGLVFKIWRNVPPLSLPTYSGIAFIVIFGTMLAYLFFLQSLRYIKATTASILGSFEPLSATVLSVLFLNVRFGWPEIIGTTLILSTVFLLSLGNKE